MFRSRFLWLASLVATTVLVLAAIAVVLPPTTVGQQPGPPVQLKTRGTFGTLAANGDAVTLTDTGGLATLAVQTKDSYSGTWEAQCSTDNGVTYDTDDEVVLVLMGDTAGTAVVSVTDAVGIWQGSIAGCNAVKVIATAGFAASDTAVQLQAITSGGGGGGGGAASSVDSELPAAAALADDTANPTVPGVAAFMMCFDGTTWDRCQTTRDPCDGAAKTLIPILISTATTTELTPSLAGASTHYYVCSINIGPVAGAQNIALADDDSDGCGSVTSGLAGGTTAANGWNIAANGGLVLGNGNATVAKTNGTNRVLCAVTSAAVVTPGVIGVVAAP